MVSFSFTVWVQLKWMNSILQADLFAILTRLMGSIIQLLQRYFFRSYRGNRVSISSWCKGVI